MTFQQAWKDVVMGQETTTTFEVTLKYAGPKKNFRKLLRIRRSTSIMETKVVASNTIKTKVEPTHTDDQKLVRAFLKQACVAAKLAWAKSQRDTTVGQYNLKYRSSWRSVGFEIALNGVNIHLTVKDKANPLVYNVQVWDLETPAYEKPPPSHVVNAYAPRVYGSSKPRRQKIPNEDIKVSIADPAALDTFTKLISKWGHINQQPITK